MEWDEKIPPRLNKGNKDLTGQVGQVGSTGLTGFFISVSG
jgi:hypothetical protein